MPIQMAYVNAVRAAFGANPGRLGQFPPGTAKTITAAEVLKNHLPANNYAGAICVVELQSRLRSVFVVSNSGAPNSLNDPASQANFGAANAELGALLGGGTRFRYGNHGQDLYNPLHANTVNHLANTISPNFDGAGNLVTLAQATAAVNAIRQIFLTPLGQGAGPAAFGGLHAGQQGYWNQRAAKRNQLGAPNAVNGANLYGLMQNIKQVGQSVLPVDLNAQNAVRDLMALALAARLRLCAVGQLGTIVNLLNTLVHDLRRRGGMDSTHSLAAIAVQAEHLYQLQHSVYENNQPPDQCSGAGAVFNGIMAAAWQMLGQSRFCAEPKAFGYIRSADHDAGEEGFSSARLLGQTCIWWTYAGGPANPAGYQVIGPQGNEGNAALAGSYMWPCPSCQNRSGQMVNGLRRGAIADGRIGISHEI